MKWPSVRYNFSLHHSPKISIQAPKIILGPHKCFQHTQLWLSQIFPILLPKLGPHKYFSYHYQIGPQNYIISTKAQTHLSCGQNPKSPNTLTKPIAHDTLKSSLLHDTLTKPIATRKSY